MVNWNIITYDEIVLLAGIASSHSMGINEMLHNLNQLDEEQRKAVNHLLQKHAEGQTERTADTL